MREPMLWAKTPGIGVQTLATMISCAAAMAYVGVSVYLLVFLLSYIVTDLAFTFRWYGTEDARKKAFCTAAFWPLTILLLYKTVTREERLRDERIVREVMES